MKRVLLPSKGRKNATTKKKRRKKTWVAAWWWERKGGAGIHCYFHLPLLQCYALPRRLVFVSAEKRRVVALKMVNTSKGKS